MPAASGPCGPQLECKVAFENAARAVISQVQEADLVGQLDRIQALIAPYVSEDVRAFHTAAEISEAQAQLRSTVLARGALIVTP